MSLTVKGFILLIRLWESLEEVFISRFGGQFIVNCTSLYP